MGETALALSRKGTLSYLHVSHCTFAVSDGKSMVLIDPFFCGQFEWKDKIEKHLDEPTVKLSAFKNVDAILVSHEHGDHYDPQTLGTLIKQTKAKIYTPQMVIDDATKKQGLDASRFEKVSRGQKIKVGDMDVTVYCAAASEQTEPVDRVGFHIAAEGRTLYHQGDSHGISPMWQPMYGGKLDAFIMWPWRVLEVAAIVKPKSIIFHHLDRFKPGNFFCNRSADLELQYHRYYHPDIDFIVPEKGKWLPVR